MFKVLSSALRSYREIVLLVMIPLVLQLLLLLVIFLTGYSLWYLAIVAGMFTIYSAFLITSYVRRRIRMLMLKEVIQDTFTGRYQSRAIEDTDDVSILGKQIVSMGAAMKEKVLFIESLQAGNIETTFNVTQEDDRLGKSLLAIREQLLAKHQEDQVNAWSSDALNRFVKILQTDANVKLLADQIVSNLVPMVGASQGALYLADRSLEKLILRSCYAFNKTKFVEQEISFGEGIIGQSFLEKETVYLKQVPQNFVRITSGLGESNPRTILIVPLKVKDEVVGIIELASFNEFEVHVVAFIEKISENIAHTFLSIQVAEQTQKLLAEAQTLTEQMRSQEEELKQNQEELQATQEEISRKYKHLFEELKKLNYQSRFDQLKSITLTRKRSVEYYFDIIRNQILTFSESTMIINAMNEFKNAFKILHQQMETAEVKHSSRLESYYEKEFLLRLKQHGNLTTKNQYLPVDSISVYLQDLYIAANPNPTGQKHQLDLATDGSEYSKVHQKYHSIIRSFLEKFGYYDIFLLDAETGYMVYSVFKEVDFATSLTTGIYNNTNFGRAVKKAIETADKDFVQLVDFEPYAPSYMAPASFIARPIFENDKKIGVLVFQMPINKINQVLTGNNQWREDGLGESGETFIVGDDLLMRSISRELTENFDAYVKRLRASSYHESIIRNIQQTQTNILFVRAELEAAKKALKGQTGIGLETDQQGIEKLCAYAPLEIKDVHWAILSTMGEEEVSLRIEALRSEQGELNDE